MVCCGGVLALLSGGGVLLPELLLELDESSGGAGVGLTGARPFTLALPDGVTTGAGVALWVTATGGAGRGVGGAGVAGAVVAGVGAVATGCGAVPDVVPCLVVAVAVGGCGG